MNCLSIIIQKTEDLLDKIVCGDMEWSELCRDCNDTIDGSIKK